MPATLAQSQLVLERCGDPAVQQRFASDLFVEAETDEVALLRAKLEERIQLEEENMVRAWRSPLMVVLVDGVSFRPRLPQFHCSLPRWNNI